MNDKNDINPAYRGIGGFKVLWAIMDGQRLRYALAIAAMLIMSGFMNLRALIVGVALDFVILDRPLETRYAWLQRLVEWLIDLGGGRESLVHHLWFFALAMVTTIALSGWFNYLRGVWSARAAENIARRLKSRLYDRLQHLPRTFFDSHDTGDLVQRCTSDVETVRMFLAAQLIEITRGPIMLLTALPLMLAMDVQLSLISLVTLPLIFAFTIVFFTRMQPVFKSSAEAEGAMTARLQENINGIRVVKAFGRGDYEDKRFEGFNAAFRERRMEIMTRFSYFWPISDFVSIGQNVLVVGMGAWFMAQGKARTPTITVGNLWIFISLVHSYLWPIRHMGRVLTEAGRSIVSLSRIGEILDSAPEADPPAPATGEIDRGQLSVRDLSFAFHGREVLSEISLEIEPGQTLGLVGPSGSGKSTLINLLLRVYDYERGSIRLDGIELTDLPRKTVRRNISAVLQEPFLYSRSLRENISFGRDGCSERDMTDAAEAAAVHDNIMGFEQGYDTVVGERGVTLSGGQRQRVTIARALLAEAPVLVLDDALSAVDTRTERAILAALERRRGRHTTILVAHRLSTLKHADRIAVLEHGRLTQCGTHDDLLAHEGLYRRLWEIQNAPGDDDINDASCEGGQHA